jgi:hypothetical protein
MRFRVALWALVMCTTAYGSLSAQTPEQSLDDYYRYPVLFGVSYESITPFAAATIPGPFNAFEVGGEVRVPIPQAPVFQPLLRGGLVSFDGQDEEEPERWDHEHYFSTIGLGLARRLSSTLELGADIAAGYSYAVFPDLIEEPVGYGNFLATLRGAITLTPTYNLSISINPVLRYQKAGGALDALDGFYYGLSFGAAFRLGQDPDAAGAEIRSLRFKNVQVPDLFAAMQSYYVENPAGSVVIENTESQEITDVEVSFMQNGFMDSPTPSASFDVIGPGEEQEIDLFASFNSRVFETEGVTPLTGEVIVQYRHRGRPAEQRASVTYDLHDKTALTWTDDRKMGAFMTPSDSALQNYGSFIVRSTRERELDQLSTPFQRAAAVYTALDALGIVYQIDPASPFTQVQENTVLVDSVSLPRNTLTRLTGDCDDLTALYASILESMGVETGFMTTPGHIYVAVNTEVAASQYRLIHPERDMTLIIDDEVWVPVEITLLGSSDFLDAWRTGMDEWQRYANETESRGFYRTRAAQQAFRPVSLTQRDLGLQYVQTADEIRRDFNSLLDRHTNTVLAAYRQEAEDSGDPRSYNRYGIVAAQLGNSAEARRAFNQAVRLAPQSLDPRINLGSLLFLNEDYRQALEVYREALELSSTVPRLRPSTRVTLLINMSRVHYQLEQFRDAGRFFELASSVDNELVQEFSYLAQASDQQGARASGADHGARILFSEMEMGEGEGEE